jgi:hypothetical protein
MKEGTDETSHRYNIATTRSPLPRHGGSFTLATSLLVPDKVTKLQAHNTVFESRFDIKMNHEGES